MLASKRKRGTMRYKMKKTISIMAAMLAVVMFFTGCQATPEQPAVIGKDMEQMLEKGNISYFNNVYIPRRSPVKRVRAAFA